MAYRVLPSDEDEIVLAFRGSFWLRFRFALRRGRAVLAGTAVGAFVVALSIASIIGWVRFNDYQYASLFAATLPAFWNVLPIAEALALVPQFLFLALACARPSPHEAPVPSRLVLRERSIDVSRRDGELRRETWRYVVEAAENDGAFELVVGREPSVTLFVSRSRLAPRQRELVTRWLTENGVARRG